MNRGMKRTATALSIGLLVTVAPAAVRAAPPPSTAASASVPSHVTLELRDAPIRQALEQLFHQAKVDYSLDNAVAGFVTLSLTDQPFDSALRLILRASRAPLTYRIEGGVYIITPRTLETSASVERAPETPRPDGSNRIVAGDGHQWDTIQVTYLDPADVAQILNITILPTFARQGGGGVSAGTAGSRTPGTGGMLGLPGAPGAGSGGSSGGGLAIAPGVPLRLSY